MKSFNQNNTQNFGLKQKNTAKSTSKQSWDECRLISHQSLHLIAKTNVWQVFSITSNTNAFISVGISGAYLREFQYVNAADKSKHWYNSFLFSSLCFVHMTWSQNSQKWKQRLEKEQQLPPASMECEVTRAKSHERYFINRIKNFKIFNDFCYLLLI